MKDQLPELQLSEEDRQKNLELLEQAKKVSDRFLTRRGRRSTGSRSESPTGSACENTPHKHALENSYCCTYFLLWERVKSLSGLTEIIWCYNCFICIYLNVDLFTTGLSPTSTPSPSPSPTPCSSRNSSVTAAPQSGKLLHSLLGPHSHNSSPVFYFCALFIWFEDEFVGLFPLFWLWDPQRRSMSAYSPLGR